jgi:hypothetical protein
MTKKFQCKGCIKPCNNTELEEPCTLTVAIWCSTPISCPYNTWQDMIKDKECKWEEVIEEEQTCFEKQTEVPIPDEQEANCNTCKWQDDDTCEICNVNKENKYERSSNS